jgi:micrococcal nuclease
VRRLRASILAVLLVPSAMAAESRPPRVPRETPALQPRPHGERVSVPASAIQVDDGDTFTIRWPDGVETVRVLAVDAPETAHLPHDIPYAQPFGPEARAFAEGAIAATTRIELLRASTLDPYGRTLGYVFLGQRNYSAMIVAARLAEEDVSRYGDNGFPKEAADVLAAAQAAGPPPFESPAAYRTRMREVSRWLKAHGQYPER